MSKLELSHVGKVYSGNVRAVNDFNLTVDDGEFIVFVGPSGCGKSTMLRMIAGIESITEGEFIMDGKVVNKVPPVDRDVSLVFQDYALYGNLSIYDNVGMSLKVRHKPRVEIYDSVMKTSNFLGLDELLQRVPNQLSGGQKQRVALGRSIARNPKLFLMDEPLSNLDAKLRAHTRAEIVRIQKELGVTTLYVTHDQVEAMTMADRIVIIKDGVIQQVGTPQDIYLNPVNEFVAGFIGMPPMNIQHGKMEYGEFYAKDTPLALTDDIKEKLKDYEGKRVDLGFRPEDVIIGKTKHSLKATLRFKEYVGGSYQLFLSAGDGDVTAIVDEGVEINDNDVEISIDLTKAHFFDAETQERIV